MVTYQEECSWFYSCDIFHNRHELRYCPISRSVSEDLRVVAQLKARSIWRAQLDGIGFFIDYLPVKDENHNPPGDCGAFKRGYLFVMNI